ncbi:interleukin-10 receptor subunit beta-like [Anguilla rostrata]|uniref:interleukin-10 receptor subunit beta-like n=1 Tax=Anguilla rostrata TaxID=7938 RepID=UPI0030D1D821
MDCTERIMVSWIICVLTALCTISVVLASVPQPENVRVTSINMDVVLEWDPPQPSSGNLTYTAGFTPEYRPVSGLRIVCQNQSERSCDFTDHLSNFGIYTFHVRAEFQTETSHWVNTSEFATDKDTLIGAPTVRLSSKAGNLEVDIQDPVTRNPGGLRTVYDHVCFNVRYWEKNKMENATVLNCEQQNSLVLSSELKPRTRYCVQAQVYIPSYEKTSDFSRVMCETITDGRAEPWLIVTVMVCSLLVMAVTVLLLFLIGWYGYKGIKFMFPKAKLPEHFKQYLVEPPHSYIFLAMQNSSQPEEKCHEVCILSELTEGTESEGTPL